MGQLSCECGYFSIFFIFYTFQHFCFPFRIFSPSHLIPSVFLIASALFCGVYPLAEFDGEVTKGKEFSRLSELKIDKNKICSGYIFSIGKVSLICGVKKNQRNFTDNPL